MLIQEQDREQQLHHHHQKATTSSSSSSSLQFVDQNWRKAVAVSLGQGADSTLTRKIREKKEKKKKSKKVLDRLLSAAKSLAPTRQLLRQGEGGSSERELDNKKKKQKKTEGSSTKTRSSRSSPSPSFLLSSSSVVNSKGKGMAAANSVPPPTQSSSRTSSISSTTNGSLSSSTSNSEAMSSLSLTDDWSPSGPGRSEEGIERVAIVQPISDDQLNHSTNATGAITTRGGVGSWQEYIYPLVAALLATATATDQDVECQSVVTGRQEAQSLAIELANQKALRIHKATTTTAGISTTATSSLFVERIIRYEQLTCAKCAFVLHQAVTLQCGHSICRKCCTVATTSATSASTSTPSFPPSSSSQRQLIPVIHCVKCGRSQVLQQSQSQSGAADGSPSQLKTNVSVMAIVDKWWAAELEAVDWRQKGNRAFNQEQLDTARQHYDKAIQAGIVPQSISLLSYILVLFKSNINTNLIIIVTH